MQFDYRDTYTFEVLPAEGGTRVKIERKFETYDQTSRAWVEKDPSKEKEAVGVPVERFIKGLQSRLEKPSPKE